MQRAGRINWLLVAILAGVVFFLIIFFGGKDSPSYAANQFLIALAKGDDKTLVEMSSWTKSDKADLEKQWKFATQVAGAHYSFIWRVKDEKLSGPNSAGVEIEFTKNVRNPGSYPENSSLPMVKVNGQWKVDVLAIDRTLYPALPH